MHTGKSLFPSLIPLTSRHFRRLARRHLHDGEPLFEAGESHGAFFVVLAGVVEIVDYSGDEPQIVTVHERGEFTGDIDILSRRRPVVSAIARGETEVLHSCSAAGGEALCYALEPSPTPSSALSSLSFFPFQFLCSHF
jgi:hypothetical protein